MSKIIAIANQKGGVGKTTTSVNLSASLAATKRRVLLIDLDPQGNATMGSGIDKNHLTGSINEILLQECHSHQTIKTTAGHYDLIPANSQLTLSEIRLLKQEIRREFALRDALALIKDRYDYIFIDCPPSLSMLTVNAFVAADSLLIPMQCEYYALEGLTALMGILDRLRQQGANTNLQIEGVLRTLYDGRNRLAVEVSDQLIAHFGEKVYRTVIPRNVRLAEAPSYGLPALLYDKGSQGAAAYLALAGEILRKHGAFDEAPAVSAEA